MDKTCRSYTKQTKQRANIGLFLLSDKPRKVKSWRQHDRDTLPMARLDRELLFNEDSIFLWDDDVLEMDGGNRCPSS